MSSTRDISPEERDYYCRGYAAGAKAEREKVLGHIADLTQTVPPWDTNARSVLAVLRRRVEEGD